MLAYEMRLVFLFSLGLYPYVPGICLCLLGFKIVYQLLDATDRHLLPLLNINTITFQQLIAVLPMVENRTNHTELPLTQCSLPLAEIAYELCARRPFYSSIVSRRVCLIELLVWCCAVLATLYTVQDT